MLLGPRFLVEAGFIVVAAVVAGLAGLSTWSIVAVAAAAWILVALVELAVWARRRRDLTSTGSDPGSSPEPEAIAAPKPEPEPNREPEPVAASETPHEWNLWELERVAREHTTDDVAKNEERAYLLIYLREFAGPDGMLPADFDGLVRDAFGDLLHAVTR